MMRKNQVFLSRPGSFWFGISLPLRSLKLILSKPKLIAWSVIPILITIFLYWLLISSLQSKLQLALNQSMISWNIDPQGWLATFILIFSGLLLVLFSALTFSFVASIAACPFNDFLAEQSESYISPSLSKVPPQNFFDKLKIIGIDLCKTLVAAAVNIIAFFCSWIPLIGFLAFGITLMLLTFQFVSYPQTRRGQGIKEGFQFIWRHFYASLGFGLTVAFLFSIPILASFALPVAVVGGTLLVARAQGSLTLPSLR